MKTQWLPNGILRQKTKNHEGGEISNHLQRVRGGPGGRAQKGWLKTGGCKRQGRIKNEQKGKQNVSEGMNEKNDWGTRDNKEGRKSNVSGGVSGKKKRQGGVGWTHGGGGG